MSNQKRLGLAIPKHLYDALVTIAGYRGQTINALCRDIFWDWLKSNAASDG